MGEDVRQSISDARVHHQLLPMTAWYETGFPESVVAGLRSRGHVTENVSSAGSVVSAIAKVGGRLLANSDKRKAGGVDGF